MMASSARNARKVPLFSRRSPGRFGITHALGLRAFRERVRGCADGEGRRSSSAGLRGVLPADIGIAHDLLGITVPAHRGGRRRARREQRSAPRALDRRGQRHGGAVHGRHRRGRDADRVERAARLERDQPPSAVVARFDAAQTPRFKSCAMASTTTVTR